MIDIQPYAELPTRTKSHLDNIIQEEFGHIPIVQETMWATPDWTVIFYVEDEIATFHNIVIREVSIDDQSFLVAGINNVITSKEFRGRGFSTKVLTDTENFLFEDLKADIGLLLCADALIPFYERLRWYKVEGSVYFDQPDGHKLWMANTMLLTRKEKTNPKIIDLNGLPW